MAMFTPVVEDTNDRVDAIEAELAATLTGRVVQAGFVPAALRTAEELEAGVVNVVTAREAGYGDPRAMNALGGTTEVLLVCHLALADAERCDAAANAAAVRAAEGVLLAQIKAFCRSKPVPGIDVILASAEFSRQHAAAEGVGWLIVNLELRPPAASTH